MFSVITKYQYSLNRYVSDHDILDCLKNISDDWLIKTFKKYSDNFRHRKDHVTVVSELTNLISYLDKQIIESEKLQMKYLEKIIAENLEHISRDDNRIIKKILNGLISIRKIHDMDPNPKEVFDLVPISDVGTEGLPVQLFRLTEFILFANTHHRQIERLPKGCEKIQIPFPIDMNLLLEQGERINHLVNKDILDNIVLTYFESPVAWLPISIDELEKRLEAKKTHGNKKVEYDDEVIKAELEKLVKKERFIHEGKYNGKANVRALSIQLLNTTFRDANNEISERQMTRRVKRLLPEHLKI